MRLSLVVPCFNGAKFLERSLAVLLGYLAGLGGGAELLVVDDGSTDRSQQLAGRLLEDQPDCHLLPADRNRGKGSAVRRGMLAARGDYVVFTDVDLAYPPSEIEKVVRQLEQGADVAIASRMAPGSTHTITPSFIGYLYTRHLASRAFNRVARSVMGFPFLDTQAGLKGFTRVAARRIFEQTVVDGFAFDVEALFLAHRLGLNVEEVPVHYSYLSEPSTVRFLGDGFRGLRDLISIRLRGSRGRGVAPIEEWGRGGIEES